MSFIKLKIIGKQNQFDQKILLNNYENETLL